jgi:quercetin dioxygenase-like cupin family protein
VNPDSQGEIVITRRDLFIALVAIAGTAGAFALANQTPVMGSAVFNWNDIQAKPTEVGSVRSFFKARTATLDELEIHVTTLEPGKTSHPPHQHPNEELIIIKQGTVETLSNGEWKRAGPGSVIFNASNQLHGLRNVGSDEAVYHVINWRSSTTPEVQQK